MKALYRNNSTLGPGHGFIAIDDLSPLPNLEGLRFSLKRGSDQSNLGPGGWQGAESPLEPDSVTLTDSGIALAVSMAVVDNLDPRESYRITLVTADGMNPVGRLEVPEVAYSLQGAEQETLAGAPPAPAVPEPLPQPEPLPEPEPEPEPLPEPEPEAEPEPGPEPDMTIPDAPPTKKGLSPLVIVLILVLLAIAAAIGWKLYSDSAEATSPAAGEPASNGKPAPPANDSKAETKSALARARELLASGADADKSLALAKELHGQPDDADGGSGADAAFLLAEDAAEKGNAEAMLLTGGFYDPADASPSGSIIKDPAQALAWYKKAKNAGLAGADERLAALREWAKAEAAKGNNEAKAVLDSM